MKCNHCKQECTPIGREVAQVSGNVLVTYKCSECGFNWTIGVERFPEPQFNSATLDFDKLLGDLLNAVSTLPLAEQTAVLLGAAAATGYASNGSRDDFMGIASKCWEECEKGDSCQTPSTN
jgi:hypothetical protein